MDKTTLRVAELDEYRNAAWAITPETLPLISALGRTRIDLEAARDMQRQPSEPNRGGGVAVLSLQGVITPGPSLLGMLLGFGGGLREFRDNLAAAVADQSVSGIVLDINSPGGSTDQLTETAAELRAARKIKPVVAVANTWAASAGYWIAAQASEVVVTPSGEVGSVGVFAVHEDLSVALENKGIKPTIVSAGKYKAEANPFEPLSDEARAMLQERADTFYGMFVADVAKGRGTTVDSVRNGFGEGRMVTAKNAVAAGMADSVDTIANVMARVARGRVQQAPAAQAATELQPPLEATEKEPDNPDPNDTLGVSEEERARIRALLAEHPIHTQETR